MIRDAGRRRTEVEWGECSERRYDPSATLANGLRKCVVVESGRQSHAGTEESVHKWLNGENSNPMAI